MKCVYLKEEFKPLFIFSVFYDHIQESQAENIGREIQPLTLRKFYGSISNVKF